MILERFVNIGKWEVRRLGCGINEIKRAPWPSQYELAGLRVCPGFRLRPMPLAIEVIATGVKIFFVAAFFLRKTKLNNHGFGLQ